MTVFKSRGGKFVAGTVVVLTAAGGGAAIAATQLDSSSAHDSAIISDAAGQLGVQPSALSSALKKAYDDQIQAKVTSGELSQSQADALKAKVDAGDVPLFSGGGGGFAFGFGGGPHGGPRTAAGFGFGFGFGLGADSSAAASYLGLTADQIKTDLQGGKTLAQIATDQGKTADGLIQAILAAQEANLDKLVTAGKLTSDQETTIEKGLTTMITNIVNGTRPAMGAMGHFGFRRGGHGGAPFQGSAPAAPGLTE